MADPFIFCMGRETELWEKISPLSQVPMGHIYIILLRLQPTNNWSPSFLRESLRAQGQKLCLSI